MAVDSLSLLFSFLYSIFSSFSLFYLFFYSSPPPVFSITCSFSFLSSSSLPTHLPPPLIFSCSGFVSSLPPPFSFYSLPVDTLFTLLLRPVPLYCLLHLLNCCLLLPPSSYASFPLPPLPCVPSPRCSCYSIVFSSSSSLSSSFLFCPFSPTEKSQNIFAFSSLFLQKLRLEEKERVKSCFPAMRERLELSGCV